jgi:hypothetical protein
MGWAATWAAVSVESNVVVHPRDLVQHHTYFRNESSHASIPSKGAIRKINTFLKMVGNGQIAGVPISDSRKELCLTFHGKGGCYMDCSHVQGHGQLSSAEVTSLESFIEKGLVKQAAIGSSWSGG